MNPGNQKPLSAGAKLPYFDKDGGHPSPYSKGDMDQLVRRLNALMDPRIVRGQFDHAYISDSNFVIQLAANIAGGGSGGSGNGFIAFGTINAPATSDDFFTITDPKGGTNVVGLVVYKPAELRPSRVSEVVFNGTNYITVSYTYSSSGTQRTGHVTSAAPNPSGLTWDDEVQTVIPQYFIQGTVNGVMYSSPIFAISADGGFTFVDANVAGRVWSALTTDPSP